MIQGEVFASSDGTPLYYEAYMPTAQRYASILIVHGYDDHAGRYRNLAQRLVDEGFGAVAFDYRGHGQASGKRGQLRSLRGLSERS